MLQMPGIHGVRRFTLNPPYLVERSDGSGSFAVRDVITLDADGKFERVTWYGETLADLLMTGEQPPHVEPCPDCNHSDADEYDLAD